MTISAIILAKNEEKNIERCLLSLMWCDEIVIIDDFSEDSTIESVKRKALSVKGKIKIYQRKLNADFATQRNFGLEKAMSDWVLFVDADEEISEELANEIKRSISHSGERSDSRIKKGFWASQNDNTNDYDGFYIKRMDYFMGRWLRYGETGNIKFIRLAKKNAGLWTGKVHESWKIKGKVKELSNPILHYPHKTISEFLQKINWYTELVVQCWKEEGRKMGFWEIIFYPLGKFLHNYLLRRGFLDGTAGFIMAIFMSFHSFLARSKYFMSDNK